MTTTVRMHSALALPHDTSYSNGSLFITSLSFFLSLSLTNITLFFKRRMDRLSALRSMLWANGFVFKLILSSLGSLAAYGLYQILRVKYRHYKSPLNILPGPPNASTIIGNLGQIRDAEPGAMHTEWIEKYGPVIQYKGFFGVSTWPFPNHVRVTDRAFRSQGCLQ